MKCSICTKVGIYSKWMQVPGRMIVSQAGSSPVVGIPGLTDIIDFFYLSSGTRSSTMEQKSFATKYFGISAEGFQFRRNGFTYKTIPLSEINSIVIERGKEMNNWLVLHLFGWALLLGAIFYYVELFASLTREDWWVFFSRTGWIPLLPGAMGVYCLIMSLKTGILLKIETIAGNKAKFPLHSIQKSGRMFSLKLYLQAEPQLRKIVTINE